ncbi:hypothetical protein DQ392_23270 [Streptomyces reniochalinae]|uniref:Uncharacterized protein n=1 Tax=Streptomyces reniochalinae TaxID=2250578 RepID=A0A367EFH2_9ACTN|nr:hypothetical protein DQ392_23270 [Streptomyces reniochalinae]
MARAEERPAPPEPRAYPVRERNGPRRVRLYDARAACPTRLARKAGADHLLARWAGRTSVRTTREAAVKPDVEDLRPAAEAWGGLVEDETPLTGDCARYGSVSG